MYITSIKLHLKDTDYLSDFTRLSLPFWIIFLCMFSDQVSVSSALTDFHIKISFVHEFLYL